MPRDIVIADIGRKVLDEKIAELMKLYQRYDEYLGPYVRPR